VTEKATGEFDITGWDGQPWDEQDGFVLSQARVTKAFHGDAEGSTSVAQLVLAMNGDQGVAYGGLERFTGNLHGRKGGFVLQHDAGADSGPGGLRWSIVPGSGTGELAGIRGRGAIRIEDGKHFYELDYDLH
jgi:uncharacterized protein DUF3224